jgi:hypothetical protein
VHTRHSQADHEREGRTEHRRPGFGDYERDAPCDVLGRSGLHADFQRGLSRARPPAPDHDRFRSIDRFSTRAYSSLGRQLSKRSEAAASFKGAMTRDQRARVYLGREFQQDRFGLFTPGPQAEGRVPAGIGTQVNSVKVNPEPSQASTPSSLNPKP